MFELTVLRSWMLLMFPLVYSPGPANIMFASNGAAFGFRRSVPFMAGIEVSFFAQSLLVGFGLGGVLLSWPVLLHTLRWVGIAYICYLGYGFLRAAVKELGERPHCLSFRDGLVMTFVNPKAWMMQVMMFSQFLSPAEPWAAQVLALSGWLAALNFTGHVVWILFGSLLVSRAAGFAPPRLQNAIYACMLFGSVLFLV